MNKEVVEAMYSADVGCGLGFRVLPQTEGEQFPMLPNLAEANQRLCVGYALESGEVSPAELPW